MITGTTEQDVLEITEMTFNEKINHFFKRRAQIIAVKNRRCLNKEWYIERNPNEKKIMGICRWLIKNESTILSYKPDGVNLGTRYVVNEKLDKYVILVDTSIKIVNGVCSYDITISPKTAKNISIMFDSKVNQMRNILEDKINSKVKHSIDTIYESLLKK